MVKEIYKPIVIISLVATVLVFFSGVLLGWTLDNFRENALYESIGQNELDLESFIIEQQMLADFSVDTCAYLSSKFLELQKQAGQIGRTMEDYEKSTSSDADYSYLKRRHIVLNTKLWLMVNMLNENCEKKQPSIIYFYSQDCRDCTIQGYFLDELNREQNYSISVFAYDADFVQESLIVLLKEKYDVQVTPTLVVNGKTKVEGLATKEEIMLTL